MAANLAAGTLHLWLEPGLVALADHQTAGSASFPVAVYAGLDPITGRRLYLRETTASRPEAERALRRLTNQVDEDRHTKTQATFRVAMESWLRTHEIDQSTKSLYSHYARVHLYPAKGEIPIGRISTRALEEFTQTFVDAVGAVTARGR